MIMEVSWARDPTFASLVACTTRFLEASKANMIRRWLTRSVLDPIRRRSASQAECATKRGIGVRVLAFIAGTTKAGRVCRVVSFLKADCSSLRRLAKREVGMVTP